MAISILHQTVNSALTQASFHITIPATSAGSTLVVSVCSQGGTTNFPFGVGDNNQGFPYYPQVVNATRTDGGIRRTAQIWYRGNVPPGITDVFIVPNDGSGMNMYAIVWELTGVNHATPFEIANFRNFNDSGSTSSGTALANTFTNAFFAGNAIRTVAATLGSATNGFTRDANVQAGSTAMLHCHKIGSGTQTLIIDHASGSAGILIGIAAFNPTPNPSSGLMSLFDEL